MDKQEPDICRDTQTPVQDPAPDLDGSTTDGGHAGYGGVCGSTDASGADTVAAETILHQLRDAGVTVTSDGDQLRLEGPPGALSGNLVDAVRRNKPGILQILRATSNDRITGTGHDFAPWELERLETVSPSMRTAVSMIKEVFGDAGGATVVRVEREVCVERRRMAKLLRKARAIGCVQPPHGPFRPAAHERNIAKQIRSAFKHHLTGTPKGVPEGRRLRAAIGAAERVFNQMLMGRT